jgi:hypothetical protein
MNQPIRIHIDTLALHGLDLSPSQGDRLKATISAELTCLLSEHIASGRELPTQIRVNGAISNLSVEMPLTVRSPSPLQIGQQISQTLYQHWVGSSSLGYEDRS